MLPTRRLKNLNIVARGLLERTLIHMTLFVLRVPRMMLHDHRNETRVQSSSYVFFFGARTAKLEIAHKAHVRVK